MTISQFRNVLTINLLSKWPWHICQVMHCIELYLYVANIFICEAGTFISSICIDKRMVKECLSSFPRQNSDSNPDHWDSKVRFFASFHSAWWLPSFTWTLLWWRDFCGVSSCLRQCSILNNSEYDSVFSTHCSWQEILDT